MRSLRILQHERRTDEIRIGRAFKQNSYSLDDIAEDVRRTHASRDNADLSKYYSVIAIIDAVSLETLYVIHSDGTQKLNGDGQVS